MSLFDDNIKKETLTDKLIRKGKQLLDEDKDTGDVVSELVKQNQILTNILNKDIKERKNYLEPFEYADFLLGDASYKTIVTAPPDKHILLTHIIVTGQANFQFAIRNTLKNKFVVYYYGVLALDTKNLLFGEYLLRSNEILQIIETTLDDTSGSYFLHAKGFYLRQEDI